MSSGIFGSSLLLRLGPTTHYDLEHNTVEKGFHPHQKAAASGEELLVVYG
jgi:hypothetical protein